MIKVGVKDRIALTDVHLETSAVISFLLDIMVKGANILDLPSENTRKQVVRFAHTIVSPRFVSSLFICKSALLNAKRRKANQ